MKIHKSIFCSLSIFLIMSALNLQAQEQETMRFGAKGGVNFSNLYSSNDSETKMLTGFNLGVFAKFAIIDHLGIQPELYYTQKGAKVTYNNDFVNGTALYNFNYLEMPILFVVNITKNFNIQVGPYGSYLVSGHAKNDSDVDLFDFEENINTDDYNKWDAGIVVGAGMNFGGFNLGARYNYGLVKIGKEKTFLNTNYRFPDAVNGVISIYASISLL